MTISGDFPNGIQFYGTEGWLFVSRGNEKVTNSDPASKLKDPEALAASDPKIITSVIGPNEIHLYESKEQHANWLDCVKSCLPPIPPVEIGHRACSACLLHHIAMKLPRKLHWDPIKERSTMTMRPTPCAPARNAGRTQQRENSRFPRASVAIKFRRQK